jgi:prepilin-type N-terminal cleavage/methylation domain-containing protein
VRCTDVHSAATDWRRTPTDSNPWASRQRRTGRGLTLLELMLALVITALVAGAISGMMHAVTTGVVTRRDNRSTMVGANAAAMRLSGYIAPARCILDLDGRDLVIWLNDARSGGTVHATEVRWLLFDADAGTIDVYFVDFPDGWSQAACDLADNEYRMDANWATVLSSYQSKGWITSMSLVDELDDMAITLDQVQPLDARHVNFDLSFQTSEAAVDVLVAATIRLHQPPSS